MSSRSTQSIRARPWTARSVGSSDSLSSARKGAKLRTLRSRSDGVSSPTGTANGCTSLASTYSGSGLLSSTFRGRSRSTSRIRQRECPRHRHRGRTLHDAQSDEGKKMTNMERGFLWGASTAPLKVEGGNGASDWWGREESIPGMAPSGDAVDSYHRFPEDMRLLAEAGLNAYRFGIEWARIEPRPGQVSRAQLGHYRRMIDTALGLGLTPVVTLHHFTNPRWFAESGGWTADHAVDHFVRYVRTVIPILGGVEWVATINEPNMMAVMTEMARAAESGELPEWQSPTVEGGVQP